MELNEDTYPRIGEGQSQHSAISPSVSPAIGELESEALPASYTLAKCDHTQGFGSFDFTQPEDFEQFKWRTGGGYKGKRPRNQFYRAARLKKKFVPLSAEERVHIANT